MKKFTSVVLACCLPTLNLFASPGIEATNYSVTGSFSSLDYGDTLSLSGQIRTPIADYTGFTFDAGFSEFDGDGNYLDTSTRSASMGLFVRRYDLGMIDLRYAYQSTDADIESDPLHTHTVALAGTYYFNRFDLMLSRSKTRPEMSHNLNSSNLGIAYYLTDNLRGGINVGGMDSKDSYIVHINYQPMIFDNAIGLSLSYQGVKDISDDLLRLSLSYFFDTKVSLLDRTRKY